MQRRTRANLNLPGNISDYLLGNNRTMSVSGNDGEEARTSSNSLEDMQALMSVMMRTITAMSEGGNNRTGSSKLEDCPVKRKVSSLEAWLDEVTLWDESNASSEPGWSAKKYLKFVESIRKSEECSDLQNYVQVEFVENTEFDKKSDSSIKSMVTKIKENLGQSDLEKCSDAWVKFISIKQDAGESTKSYVARFEQTEALLKNVSIAVPNKVLGIHLLHKSSLLPQSK